MKLHRFRVPLTVLAGAVVLASIEAAGTVSRRTMSGGPADWPNAIRPALALWLAFAALVPVPAAMAARFPLDRHSALVRLPLHFFAAIVFVALHLALDIVVQTALGHMRPEPFGPHLLFLFQTYAASETTLYAAITAAFMVARARREADARSRAAESLQAQLQQSQLAALRAQLAPHFLFNTLNAISTLAARGDTEGVGRAIGALADLLRAVLDETRSTEVALSDELEFLERYLELQQLRFPDRLHVLRAIAPETLTARVPRLLLQPVVENAVEHGLAVTGAGQVELSARREAGELVLEVGNSHGGPPAPGGTGIGLANTRSRLAAVHGDAATLDLCAREGGGATVRIRMPFRTSPMAAS